MSIESVTVCHACFYFLRPRLTVYNKKNFIHNTKYSGTNVIFMDFGCKGDSSAILKHDLMLAFAWILGSAVL